MDYRPITSYQERAGYEYTSWSTGSWKNATQVYELTATQQNNGCIKFWSLTMDQQWITISQTAPGGDWGEWTPMEFVSTIDQS